MSDEVFFTADTHFGHGNVIEFCDRPFEDREEMDEALIERWNSVVGIHDRVYHLGDFSFRGPGPSIGIKHRLNGRIYLVEGNHDRRMKAEVRQLFEWVKPLHELRIEGQKIVLCHYPLLTWNASHRGSWSLHGHSHGNLREDPNVRRIDVGVDCHDYRPISFAAVKKLMEKKGFTAVDHHKERS